MAKKFYSVAASFLAVLAVVAASGPSWLYIHQEETPAELLK